MSSRYTDSDPTVYFAVPSHYTIGTEFTTFEEAVQYARSTIAEFRYPGQRLRTELEDYDPRRHFQDGDVLVHRSRAFVDVRVRDSHGDHPLVRWEVFFDSVEFSDKWSHHLERPHGGKPRGAVV